MLFRFAKNCVYVITLTLVFMQFALVLEQCLFGAKVFSNIWCSTSENISFLFSQMSVVLWALHTVHTPFPFDGMD